MATWRELTFRGAATDEELTIDGERATLCNDPLRWRILHAADGGKTLEELSAALQVTDARLRYHAERLVVAGALRVVGPGRRYQPTAARMRVRDTRQAEDGNPTAIPDRVAGDFNQAAREAAEGVFGAAYQFMISHNRARLSEAQAAEFGKRLVALVEEYFPPGKGDRTGTKYGFYGVLTPIDLHPLDD